MTGLQRQPAVVFFDFNYTLADFVRPMRHYEAIAEWLRKPPGEVASVLRRYEERYETGLYPEIRMRKVLQRLGIRLDLDPDLIRKLIRLEQRRCLGAMELYPGALDLLDWLRSRQIKIILVCNGNPNTKFIVERLGVLDRCNHTVFSCDSEVRSQKPNAPIYRRAMGLARVPEAAGLYVGDGGNCELGGLHRVYPGIPRVRVDHPIDGRRRDPGDPRLELGSEFVIPHIADLRGLFSPVASPT